MDIQTKEEIQEIFKKAVCGTGYVLISLDFHQSAGRLALSAVLDNESGGISLDQCIAWNKQFSDNLELEKPGLENYVIEVASPGLDRKLSTRDDFKWAVGKVVTISFKDDLAKDQQQTVRFLNLEESALSCESYPDGIRFELSLDRIIHARLKPIIKQRSK